LLFIHAFMAWIRKTLLFKSPKNTAYEKTIFEKKIDKINTSLCTVIAVKLKPSVFRHIVTFIHTGAHNCVIISLSLTL
jgi:hypothetical protein